MERRLPLRILHFHPANLVLSHASMQSLCDPIPKLSTAEKLVTMEATYGGACTRRLRNPHLPLGIVNFWNNGWT